MNDQRGDRAAFDPGNDLGQPATRWVGFDAGQARPGGVRVAVGAEQELVARFLAWNRIDQARPEHVTGEFTEQEQFLGGGARGADGGDAGAAAIDGLPQAGGELAGNIRPGQVKSLAEDLGFHARGGQPVRVIDKLVVQPAVIAHPALVHVLVVAGGLAIDHALARPEHGVAAGSAARADALGFLEEPDTLLEPEIVRGQRADRAKIDDIEIVIRVRFLARVTGQGRVTAALDEPETVLAGDFVHEPDATRAENAALVVERDLRPDRRFFRLVDLRLDEPAFALAVIDRELLQAALAGLVADRAVERVVDQQELHHPFAGVDDFLGRGMNDHPLANRRVAPDRQFRCEPDHRVAVAVELRLAVLVQCWQADIDQAHPAIAGDRELGMVTIMRDLDPDRARRLDQVGPFRRAHGPPIDRQVDKLVSHRLVPSVPIHAVSPTLFAGAESDRSALWSGYRLHQLPDRLKNHLELRIIFPLKHV